MPDELLEGAEYVLLLLLEELLSYVFVLLLLAGEVLELLLLL